jgi:hypothetical protein
LPLWTDDPDDLGKTDHQGNEIRPTQIEVFSWMEKYASDDTSGYVIQPYRFLFEKGANTLTLEGVSEPLAISALSLEPVTEEASYAAYAAQLENAADDAVDVCKVLQGGSVFPSLLSFPLCHL